MPKARSFTALSILSLLLTACVPHRKYQEAEARYQEAEAASAANAAKARDMEAQATEWKGVENLARERLAEVFQATGQANWSTPAGKAYRAADSVTVSWDAKALDALCASSPQIAAVLAPHRRETVRSGALSTKPAVPR
jgi:hypothetical protein